MALSGSLLDFDISYIFQIIAQEGKTGKLVLYSNELEGYVVFKKGQIIYAGSSKQDLQSMLFKYLLTIKNYPNNEIVELRTLYHNNIRHLSQELIEKNYIPIEEFSVIIETGIFDIACNFFQWKRGNYRFDTLPNTDLFQIGDFSISSDAITMEAARRTDEYQRFKKAFNKDTVFIRSETSNFPENITDSISPLDNFAEYLLYKRIDGTSSVEFLCQTSFFSEYQIYEALFTLLQAKQIIPLSHKISDSVNAALKRTGDTYDSLNSKIIFSSIITVTCIIIIYFLGNILIKGFLFADTITQRDVMKSELNRIQSNQKISIATLQYQAEYGSAPLLLKDLVKKEILTKRDLNNFLKSSIETRNTKHLSR